MMIGALFFASAAVAKDARDITVINKSGKPITELYISPADSSDWEEDVLGVDVLEDGESIEIHFSGYKDNQCLFDVLARNARGDEWLLTDLNLCEIFTITITKAYIKAK
jgi:hypothetical protein